MAIELKNVTRRFKDTLALDNISVSFENGKIYGLLGSNGAGKSTMLNIITNRLFASDGTVTIDGERVENSDAAMSKLFMQGEANLYPESMRVNEAFKTAAQFYENFDINYAYGLCEKFGLKPKKKIKSLSTGYASIFRLIVALSVNTPYVLFDEPVLGLDAIHRDLFYKTLIEKYSATGATYIVSTHLIQEIANIIEHAVIIKDGKIVRDMPSDEITKGSFSVSGPANTVDEFIKSNAYSVISETVIGGLKTVCVEGATPDGKLPAGLETGAVQLQDYFIALMCKEEIK